MEHFEKLRRKIREKVLKTCGEEEMAKYPDWLYGALGNPRADVMFVCENPSRQGVEWADEHVSHFGIEAQWRGHRAERFRRVLCQSGLRCGGPDEDGGWRCYITNVIKEIWTVGIFNKKSPGQKLKLACKWADVLHWEIASTSKAHALSPSLSGPRRAAMSRTIPCIEATRTSSARCGTP